MLTSERLYSILLRTGPHGIPIQNQDVAGTSKENATFCDSSQVEGLGFNLCVASADSLSHSIFYNLSVRIQEGSWRERAVMILVNNRTEV